jgi:lipid-binding SYLF domain-containing protein
MKVMNPCSQRVVFYALLMLAVVASPLAVAKDRSGLDEDVQAAIEALRNATPAAAELAKNARGLLIFPNIVKAGFIIGAQYGEGALVKRKEGGGYYIDEYYSLASASYGLQAGVQSFGYALMLMTDSSVGYVETSSNWDLGVGPNIVVVDAGVAKELSTKTAKADIYAFTFGQKGLMAGLGLQGSKITKLRD